MAEPTPTNPEWLRSLSDPVREELLRRGAEPDLDAIRALFPPLTGEPAFDPALIRANAERLRTVPEVRTGHPFLDLSVRTGLAHVDATFQGDHPKYGVKEYAAECHDGFPPTIIAAVDALSAWGLNARGAQLFRYWLANFVRDDGSIRYRGTSLAELGQLLHTAALLFERAGPAGWWPDGRAALERLADGLLALHGNVAQAPPPVRTAEGGCAAKDGLLTGVPEDDEKEKVGKYFHNNAWIARGLREFAELGERTGLPAARVAASRAAAERLADDTLRAIRARWPVDPAETWLPPQAEPLSAPANLAATRVASYTNYRYWPELLASGLLPRAMAERLVESRLRAGGQFCGMTRFEGWLDDWPLADYLFGLRALGREWDFKLSLFGHASYHQAADHLTAYEQVTFPPGRSKAAYCLPCQLVAARAARGLVKA